jgi:hypothetical protein
MNLPDGWTRKQLPNNHWEITIPIRNVGIKSRTKELWIRANYPFAIGDIIVIKDRINAIITKCKSIEDEWYLTVESEKDILWEIIRR